MHADTPTPHRPTSQPLAPPALYLTAEHQEHLEGLIAALHKDVGVAVLTTDTGGATESLTQHVMDSLGDKMRIARVLQPRMNLLDFLYKLCQAYRIPLSSGEHTVQLLQDLLLASLRQSRANGRHNLLVINEAQNAPFFVLRQLLPLCAPDAHGERPLQVLLIGQPALLKLLAQAELAPVKAMVTQDRRLGALTLEQTQDYIRQKLSRGATPLSPEAVQHIHTMSEGRTALIDQWYEETMHPSPVDSSARTQPQALDERADRQRAWEHHELETATGAPDRRKWAYIGGAAVAVLALVMSVLAALPANDDGEPTASAPTAPLASGVIADDKSRLMPASLPAPSAAPAEPVRLTEPAPTLTPVSAEPSPTATVAAPVGLKRPALADLDNDASGTWPVLGRRWNVNLSADNPCDDALAQGLQCFRKADMDLALLRQFDRPGLLQLRENGVERWVHLVAIDGADLTLSSGGTTWRMPASELPIIWTGFYSTLWRLPAGQTRRLFTAVPEDAAGQWLNAQLKKLQNSGELPATADNLNARVLAFQQKHKLYGDGKAVPSTFLLANRLAGVPEPRLSAGGDKRGT